MEDAAKLKVLTRILIMSCYTDMILCKVVISSILHNCRRLSENTNSTLHFLGETSVVVAIEEGSEVLFGVGMQFLIESGIAKTEFMVIGRSFGIIFTLHLLS